MILFGAGGKKSLKRDPVVVSKKKCRGIRDRLGEEERRMTTL